MRRPPPSTTLFPYTTLFRSYLLKAVQLAQEYPDNHISLIESFIEWSDVKAARNAVSQAESPMRQARLALTGERWKESWGDWEDRKSTRLNSSHGYISYAVFC